MDQEFLHLDLELAAVAVTIPCFTQKVQTIMFKYHNIVLLYLFKYLHYHLRQHQKYQKGLLEFL